MNRKGQGLIEILISICILSISFTAVIKLQNRDSHGFGKLHRKWETELLLQNAMNTAASADYNIFEKYFLNSVDPTYDSTIEDCAKIFDETGVIKISPEINDIYFAGNREGGVNSDTWIADWFIGYFPRVEELKIKVYLFDSATSNGYTNCLQKHEINAGTINSAERKVIGLAKYRNKRNGTIMQIRRVLSF